MKVEYDEQKKEWVQLELNSKEGMYIDGKLKERLDNIKEILKYKWDAPIMIDGLEGSGKTTLGLTCAWYLSDKQFKPNNICRSAKDTIKKLHTFPEGSVLLVDEGDLAFSSKDIFNKEQKDLIKLMKIVRYRQHILIVIAPTFFDLNKYISVHRSRFLLHVYTDKNMKRGRFAYFGTKKKRMLYEIGKKNYGSYSKPKADFVGTFTDFNPLGEAYHEAKDEIVDGLLAIEDDDRNRDRIQKYFLINYIVKDLHVPQVKLAKAFEKCEYPLKRPRICDICLENKGKS